MCSQGHNLPGTQENWSFTKDNTDIVNVFRQEKQFAIELESKNIKKIKKETPGILPERSPLLTFPPVLFQTFLFLFAENGNLQSGEDGEKPTVLCPDLFLWH